MKVIKCICSLNVLELQIRRLALCVKSFDQAFPSQLQLLHSTIRQGKYGKGYHLAPGEKKRLFSFGHYKVIKPPTSSREIQLRGMPQDSQRHLQESHQRTGDLLQSEHDLESCTKLPGMQE
jgi:hypothetical protein